MELTTTLPVRRARLDSSQCTVVSVVYPTEDNQATHLPGRTVVGQVLEELPGSVVRHRRDEIAPEPGGVDACGRRGTGHGQEEEGCRVEQVEELHCGELLLAEDSVVGWRATGRRAGFIYLGLSWSVFPADADVVASGVPVFGHSVATGRR